MASGRVIWSTKSQPSHLSWDYRGLPLRPENSSWVQPEAGFSWTHIFASFLPYPYSAYTFLWEPCLRNHLHPHLWKTLLLEDMTEAQSISLGTSIAWDLKAKRDIFFQKELIEFFRFLKNSINTHHGENQNFDLFFSFILFLFWITLGRNVISWVHSYLTCLNQALLVGKRIYFTLLFLFHSFKTS